MNKFLSALFCVSMFIVAAPSARAADFADAVDLSPLAATAVQDNSTMKTFDSYARQTLTAITGSSTLDGHSAMYVILDMSFRPEAYRDENLIKIRNVPLRKEFLVLDGLGDDEQKRIVHDGTVSLNFWNRADVKQLHDTIMANDVRKATALQQTDAAAALLAGLVTDSPFFPPVAMIAPAPNSDDDKWHELGEMAGTVPAWAASVTAAGGHAPAALAGYDPQLLQKIVQSVANLIGQWRNQDAAGVNASLQRLAYLLPRVNPAAYPSSLKRHAEVFYNRLAKMTIPGAAFYFIAFVCFLMSARSGVPALRLWGLRFMAVAFAIHAAGIGIRWWLVGDVFPPIKNEFESVMFSAFFGAAVGLILELRKGRGMFGAAASFVGCLSLVAIFAAPFVAGRDIGGEIGQVNGVLMSYWLYIHVTMVTAAYALIGMGFLLSAWWLIKYYANYSQVADLPAFQLSSDAAAPKRPRAAEDDASFGGAAFTGSVYGGAAAMNFTQTLASLLFLRKPIAGTVASKDMAAPKAIASDARSFLATLDLCNLVVLQLAFWVLGAGIVCGAIWADQSWGRPWGWDPKETFALVTWIVYLIVVHVRVATEDKAWWTAVLSCIGFFIMLFNWIGVNFFLVGLHSYA